MYKIVIIAAVGKNLELGKNNGLIWRLPEDLKFFKNHTIGHPILMGSKTLDSLPRKLKDRPYIVLTSRGVCEDKYDDIKVVHSIDEALAYIKSIEDDVYVIGGASIYRQMLDYSDEMYLTEVEAEDKEADAYFPKFNQDDWEEETLSNHITDEGIKYKHKVYKRK